MFCQRRRFTLTNIIQAIFNSSCTRLRPIGDDAGIRTYTISVVGQIFLHTASTSDRWLNTSSVIYSSLQLNIHSDLFDIFMLTFFDSDVPKVTYTCSDVSRGTYLS